MVLAIYNFSPPAENVKIATNGRVRWRTNSAGHLLENQRLMVADAKSVGFSRIGTYIPRTCFFGTFLQRQRKRFEIVH